MLLDSCVQWSWFLPKLVHEYSMLSTWFESNTSMKQLQEKEMLANNTVSNVESVQDAVKGRRDPVLMLAN